MEAFCRLHELHPQGRKVRFEDEDDAFIAQNGCCTFVPRRTNKAQKIERVQLSHCQKNWWDDDWAQYWFYAKVAFPSGEKLSEVSYPLASKIGHLEQVS